MKGYQNETPDFPSRRCYARHYRLGDLQSSDGVAASAKRRRYP